MTDPRNATKFTLPAEKTASTSDLLAQVVEDNLSAKSLSFAALPGGQLHLGNPTWFTSGLMSAGYNGITLAQFDAFQVHEQIEAAIEPFRQANIPLTWWVGPLSQPANLGRYLQAHSFFHNRDMIGMAARLEDLAPVPVLPAEYTFEPVTNRDELEAWMPVFMQAFSVPGAACTSGADSRFTLDVFDQASFSPTSEWRHYAIRLQNRLQSSEVVATGSLHLGAGVAGLYNIATNPIYRQHGLGNAITLLIYAQAREWGYQVGTLQSTFPNALRLYHRMGFEIYCKFGVYQRSWNL